MRSNSNYLEDWCAPVFLTVCRLLQELKQNHSSDLALQKALEDLGWRRSKFWTWLRLGA